MQIVLYHIDPSVTDGKKTFTAPTVPMLAKRKYLEIEAAKEKKGDDASKGYTTEEFDELCIILTDIVFRKQFTLDQLIEGASEQYIMDKLLEAVFGIKPENELKEGNTEGK